jgi:RNA polymerase sigma-70 factor (ECF subfamily)
MGTWAIESVSALTVGVEYATPSAMGVPRSVAEAPPATDVSAAEGGTQAGAAEWSREDFSRAIQPLMPRLYRLALALSRDVSVAEDVLQSSLVRAYVRRASFSGTGSLFGWLCQIVRHTHADRCRTEARRRGIFEAARDSLQLLADAFQPDRDPEEWACDNDSAEHLLACLRQVPEKYRVVLVLCDLEELTHAEAAEALGLPIGTIKSRQSRGRAMLRRAYERHNDEGGNA